MSLFRHTDAEGDVLEVDEGIIAITHPLAFDPRATLHIANLPEEDVAVAELVSAILVATGKTILAVGESSVVVGDAG